MTVDGEQSEPSNPAVWRPGLDEVGEDEELQYDPSTYDCMHTMSLDWPCLRCVAHSQHLPQCPRQASSLFALWSGHPFFCQCPALLQHCLALYPQSKTVRGLSCAECTLAVPRTFLKHPAHCSAARMKCILRTDKSIPVLRAALTLGLGSYSVEDPTQESPASLAQLSC